MYHHPVNVLITFALTIAVAVYCKPGGRATCHALPSASLCNPSMTSSRVTYFTGEKRVRHRLQNTGYKMASKRCRGRLVALTCEMTYHRCDRLSGPKAAAKRRQRRRRRQTRLLRQRCARVKDACKGQLKAWPFKCRRIPRPKQFCCQNSRRKIVRRTYARLNYDYAIKASITTIVNTGLMVFFTLDVQTVYIELEKGLVVTPKYKPFFPEKTNPDTGNITMVNYLAQGCICPDVKVGVTYLILGYYDKYKGLVLTDASTVIKWTQKAANKIMKWERNKDKLRRRFHPNMHVVHKSWTRLSSR